MKMLAILSRMYCPIMTLLGLFSGLGLVQRLVETRPSAIVAVESALAGATAGPIFHVGLKGTLGIWDAKSGSPEVGSVWHALELS